MDLKTTMGRRCVMGGLLAVLAFGCSAGSENSAADGNGKLCIPTSEPIKLDSESASAGFLSNLTGSAGSIRAASKTLLTSALDTATSKNPVSWVRFTSMPTLAKERGEDYEMCMRLEQATRVAPLTFEEKHFDTVDDLTSWITDFTQGKGADGKLLYEQCPGKCSPRYTWWIKPDEKGMLVTPMAVCGPPRDRDGDIYQLTTAIAAPCSD